MIPNTEIAQHQKSFKSSEKCNCKSQKKLKSPPENKTYDSPVREILVPADVDVNSLVDKFNLSETISKNLTARIYYFLSKILTTNDNYKLNKDGYHHICSSGMKRVVDNRYYNKIIDLLSDPDDPIIESNKSYHPSNPGKNNGVCKGFRLTPKYNTGYTKTFELPDNLWRRTLNHSSGANQEIPYDYEFLIEQVDHSHISFSSDVFHYIQSIRVGLLSKVEENNPYQISMIYDRIGRWLYYVNKINLNKLWRKVSPSNHRLNSNITNLPRELRPYLRVNDRPLGMIDVSSSQPLILASIMDINFFNNTTPGYNLYTIYPALYKMLVDEGYIKTNASYSSGTTNNYTTNISGASTNYSKENPTHTSPPFMWCHFSDEEVKSIRDYQSAPFDKDFYLDVLESYTQTTGEVIDDSVVNRQKLKNTMMLVLFDDNYCHRKNKYIQMFGAVYPGVDKWINEIHRIIGKSQFAYLLQRCESYLMLNVVAREFHRQYPEAPVFSIHDALLTYDEYLPELAGIILDQFKGIIGIDVGLKVNKSPETPRFDLEDIDGIWKEIKPINTEKRFEKVADSVLQSNIDSGRLFLSTQQ